MDLDVQSEVVIEESYNYEKQVNISDPSGQYYVRAILGANEEALIKNHLDMFTYELVLVYDQEQSGKEIGLSDGTAFKHGNDDLNFLIEEVVIDELAAGFALRVTVNEKVEENARVQYYHTTMYTGPKKYHHGKVEWKSTTNQDSDVAVKWYYKPSAFKDWRYWQTIIISASSPVTAISYSGHRIRARVMHNWQNYEVYFKKYGGDSWGSPRGAD